MDIVNLFYTLARTHEDLRAFEYKAPYDKGAGNSVTPYMSLEDPYTVTIGKKILDYTANFLILYSAETPVSEAQYDALNITLQVLENLKATAGLEVTDAQTISLRRYGDANEAGQRVTVRFQITNFVNRCETGYDPQKVFTQISALPSFSVANPEGCAVFAENNGLPVITL